MISPTQKQTAQAIVNVFETGRIHGEYGQVTLLAHDTGHLTYGRSQTTLTSGNLYLLIKAYCEADGAEYSDSLMPFLGRLEDLDLSLDQDLEFRNILRNAGDDPVMRSTQDSFFDRVYWEPTLKSADYIGAESGLGTAIVYDSRIHGSWHAIRDATIAETGSLTEVGEEAWFGQYLSRRHQWLATHANPGLHATVYRMESFQELISEDKWDLELPVSIRGITIDQTALDTPYSASPWAGSEQERILKLRTPYMQGEDVRRLQEVLIVEGAEINADGIFGPGTESALKTFQDNSELTADGIAGPATQAALTP